MGDAMEEGDPGTSVTGPREPEQHSLGATCPIWGPRGHQAESPAPGIAQRPRNMAEPGQRGMGSGQAQAPRQTWLRKVGATAPLRARVGVRGGGGGLRRPRPTGEPAPLPLQLSLEPPARSAIPAPAVT